MPNTLIDSLHRLLARPPAERDERYWREVQDQAAALLAQHVGGTLRYVDEPDLGEGFSREIRIAPQTGALQCHWHGILGCDLLENGPRVSAILFPSLGGKQVAPSGRDYLLLRYRTGLEPGGWSSLGWHAQEPGEFSHFLPETLDD